MKLCRTLPQYVALSHCWGSCPTLKTLSTNIERFRIGVPLQDLPSTFKDAVKMTKQLGFDYIWIDSLCIVQDSPTDWEEQSNLMALVYGNAELVLAALSASSTEDGFLRERKGHRESPLQLISCHNHDITLNLRYRLLEPKDVEFMRDALDCRAWALQERLLARRYLAFGSQDTSWTCTTSLACECEYWRVASIWRRESPNVARVLRDSTDEELTNCWRGKVLQHYFRRRLTVPSDKLVAISAIASVFQEKLGPDYCAGIWQRDLIPGLLWGSGGQRHTGYASDHSAPSWSWASLPTLDLGSHKKYWGNSKSEALAKILETKTTAATTNPFGSVHSGFIKLRGQMWRAEVTASELLIPLPKGRDHWLKIEGYFKNWFMIFFDTSMMMVDVCLSDGGKERSMRRVRREEAQAKFYIGNLDEHETVNLCMVPLLREIKARIGSKESRTYGLILGRSSKDPTKFERIGFFITHNLTAIHSRGHNERSLEDNGGQELVII